MEAASWNHSISSQNKDRNVIFHIYNADKRNFSDAPHVNKFKVSWVAGNKCLYRGGNILQIVPFTMSSIIYWFPCRFKRFLLQNRSHWPQLCIFLCTYTVKNNSRLHTRASSDIEGIKNPFADSLILFGNLIKEKHAGLKQYDGSFVIIHQEVLYKHLFGTEFQGHHALENVKAKANFCLGPHCSYICISFQNYQQKWHNRH